MNFGDEKIAATIVVARSYVKSSLLQAGALLQELSTFQALRRHSPQSEEDKLDDSALIDCLKELLLLFLAKSGSIPAIPF